MTSNQEIKIRPEHKVFIYGQGEDIAFLVYPNNEHWRVAKVRGYHAETLKTCESRQLAERELTRYTLANLVEHSTQINLEDNIFGKIKVSQMTRFRLKKLSDKYTKRLMEQYT